jgi:hypothetical protein
MSRTEPDAYEAIGEIAGKPLVDASSAITQLEERYGFDTQLFERYVVVRLNREYLGLVDKQCNQPLAVAAESMGLRFLRVAMAHPTLTAEAALLLAPHATRHVIELSDEQALAQLTRQPFRVTAAQLSGCQTPGQVLYLHRGLSLGAGLFRSLDPADAPESMFPRAWCLPKTT